jgi:cobalamin synthase
LYRRDATFEGESFTNPVGNPARATQSSYGVAGDFVAVSHAMMKITAFEAASFFAVMLLVSDVFGHIARMRLVRAGKASWSGPDNLSLRFLGYRWTWRAVLLAPIALCCVWIEQPSIVFLMLALTIFPNAKNYCLARNLSSEAFPRT